MLSSRALGLEDLGLDGGLEAGLVLARQLDLRSLCRLERVSKSMRRIASHKSLYANLRRLSLLTTWRLLAHSRLEFIFHVFTTNVPCARMSVGGGPERLKRTASALTRCVLERGARLASLEILAKDFPANHPWHPEMINGLLQGIRAVLEERDVRLTSLVVNCGHYHAHTPLEGSLLKSQAGTLVTLVMGQREGRLDLPQALEGAPAFESLKHLVLHWWEPGLEGWLVPLWGQLELFVVSKLGPAGPGAEALEAMAKESGSRLERRRDLEQRRLGPHEGLVLAVPELREDTLSVGPLHSVDFLKETLYSILND